MAHITPERTIIGGNESHQPNPLHTLLDIGNLSLNGLDLLGQTSLFGLMKTRLVTLRLSLVKLNIELIYNHLKAFLSGSIVGALEPVSTTHNGALLGRKGHIPSFWQVIRQFDDS